MKGFNQKRLILSLATSVVLTALMLAPLSGLHTPGNAYADPVHPLNFIHVKDPATVIDTSTTTTTINVETQYRCAPSTPYRYITPGKISVALKQPTTTSTGTAASPSVICDNREHDASINVTTTKSTPPLDTGKANVAATLSNNDNFIPHNIVATTTSDINLD